VTATTSTLETTAGSRRRALESPLVIAFGIVLLAGALVLGVRLLHASAPYDDAFITLRYARNFAEGQGFVYNEGEKLLGTSAPFLAFVLGLCTRVFGPDPLWFASWFSAFALATAGWYTFRLVRADFGDVAAVVAGLSVAINPALVSVWGGEWLIAIAAMAAGFYYYRAGRLPAAGVSFSLAVLLRAEAIIGAAIVVGHALVTRRKDALKTVAIGAAIGLAWALVAWMVIGRITPSTLATKRAHGQARLFFTFVDGTGVIFRQFLHADSRMYLAFALAWHGLVYALLKRGVWLLIPLWIAAHVAFYVSLGLPFYHWYLAPAAFGLSLAVGVGVAGVRAYASLLVPGRAASQAVSVLLIVVLAGAALAAEWRSTVYWVRIKPDPRERVYNRVGEWLAANTPASASVAYAEIGRVGYYSRRRIIDQMGLVTPGASDRVLRRDFLWTIYTYQPDYYLVNSLFVWTGSLASEPWFARSFERVASFAADDGGMKIDIFRKRPGATIPESPEMETLQGQSPAVVGEMLPGHAHAQTFVANHDRLTMVSTYLATYGRTNHGRMRFTLEQLDPPRVVHQEEFDMATVANNDWRSFSFASIEASAGKRFRFTIEPVTSAPGNAITVWYTPTDTYPDGEHLLNGSPAGGDLTLRLRYDTPR
jgi:arabinofuranosyltransferase